MATSIERNGEAVRKNLPLDFVSAFSQMRETLKLPLYLSNHDDKSFCMLTLKREFSVQWPILNSNVKM